MYNDLTGEQTHKLFVKFVDLWNGGRLAQKYYAGAVALPTKRTAHNWSFKYVGKTAYYRFFLCSSGFLDA